MKVEMTVVDHIHSAPPGAVKYQSTGLFFTCPCGCKSVGFLEFRKGKDHHPSWILTGPRDSATLYPSVNCTGFACGWHGWLRNGKWTS